MLLHIKRTSRPVVRASCISLALPQTAGLGYFAALPLPSANALPVCGREPFDKAAGFGIISIEGRCHKTVSPKDYSNRVDRSGASRTVNTLLWSVCRPKRPNTPETGVLGTTDFSTPASPPFAAGAKSASGGTPLRVFLPPLPCASSPRESLGLRGGPRRWADRLLCNSVLPAYPISRTVCCQFSPPVRGGFFHALTGAAAPGL